jgi:hypothetical protein
VNIAVDLVATTLAVRALLEAWFNEDSILAERRAATQEWASWFWSKLLNCRLCLSYWVPPVALILPFYVASLFLPDPWSVVAKLPIYSLAVTGLVWITDRVLKSLPPESGGAPTKDNDEPERDAEFPSDIS